MITSVIDFIQQIKNDLDKDSRLKWHPQTKPWFRGESPKPKDPRLCPKIAKYAPVQKTFNIENYFMQTFRQKAEGMANVPAFGETNKWLFLAQHYGVPTRLLDWTESAFAALYFAINNIEKGNPFNETPYVFMLNSHEINTLARKCIGIDSYTDLYRPNYPLTQGTNNLATLYIRFAWENRLNNVAQISFLKGNQQEIQLDTSRLTVPLAFPAVCQDQRMIAQRSCFTIHGFRLDPMQQILEDEDEDNNIERYLIQYEIDAEDDKKRADMLSDLSLFGVSASTIFPDLDHLSKDLIKEIEFFKDREPT
jgi:hypothetical protein